MTLAALIGAAAHHRLVEQGDASVRLLTLAARSAACALLFLAVVIGCDGFIVSDYYLGGPVAIAIGGGSFAIAMIMWFVLGFWLRAKLKPKTSPDGVLPVHEETPLHEKIKQMLDESWVVLPGATGIFGFQLIITMTPSFEQLPREIQMIHFAALALIALGIILLVAPAAIHRIAFYGSDDARSHFIGSRLVTVALAPLALGISSDFYVAVGRLLGYGGRAALLSLAILSILATTWYLVPWTTRERLRFI